MMILLERQGIAGLPQMLEGVTVTQRVTGRLMVRSDPTLAPAARPGRFFGGASGDYRRHCRRARADALGRVYILSNNHVLANSNNASIGDPQYQPGPGDGGTAADQIATLSDFRRSRSAAAPTTRGMWRFALSSGDL